MAKDVCYIGALRPHVAHDMDGGVLLAHIEFSYLVASAGKAVLPPDKDHDLGHRHLDVKKLGTDLQAIRDQAERQVLSVYTDHKRSTLTFVWLDAPAASGG